MGNVFVSYRRADSAPYAGRICDRLEAAFGAEHVFIDVQDIAPGSDFAEAIETTVSKSDVLIAVIGPLWLDILRTRGDNHDFVEYEIAAALRRGITVIPVLVGGATLPSERDLPAQLAGLARRQAIVVRDDKFDSDMNEVVQGIRRAGNRGLSSKRLVWTLVIAGVMIAVTGSLILLSNARKSASLDGTWIARMERPGQRPYNIRLRFVRAGRMLTGAVQYPTGSGAIQEGTVERNRITFFTQHQPQFEAELAKIMFTGEMRGRRIELTLTTPDGGVTRGIARKAE